MAPFRHSIIMGMMAMIRIPTVSPASISSSLARLNFFRSWSSRTKAFTTRMATRFSWRTLFSPSIFFCMASKSLVHTLISTAMASAIRGMTTSRITASLALRYRLTPRATRSITGARTSIRRPIDSIMVMALTSLVMRVIREAEEKRSMSAKEKSCTLLNRHWRRLPPKPWLAKVAYLAEPTPQAIASRARTSISPPMAKI